MNIPKAIEILTHYAEEAARHNLPDYAEAQRLSIEALKFIKGARQNPNYYNISPLSGETTED